MSIIGLVDILYFFVRFCHTTHPMKFLFIDVGSTRRHTRENNMSKREDGLCTVQYIHERQVKRTRTLYGVQVTPAKLTWRGLKNEWIPSDNVCDRVKHYLPVKRMRTLFHNRKSKKYIEMWYNSKFILKH